MLREQMHGSLLAVVLTTLALNSMPQSGQTEGDERVQPHPTSTEVANAIADSLRKSGLRGRDIEIEYARRNVILRGFMYDEASIQRATRAALTVDPGMTVDNRLQVGVSRAGELVPELAAPADTPAEASSARSAAETTRKRNTIILAMLVAGIALTGLLLLIAAVVARGFLRKMAHQSEAKRRAELTLLPDVAAGAEAAAIDGVNESVPFSERETEVT